MGGYKCIFYLLYGYCLYIIMFNNEMEQETKNKEQTAVSEETETLHMGEACNHKRNANNNIEETYPSSQMQLTNAEINDKLRAMGLTKRETEIAYAIIKGMTNREIAEQYYVSEATVKKHISHIFEKLGVQKREEIKWSIYKDYFNHK